MLVVAIIAVIATTFLGRASITDGIEVNGIRIVKDSSSALPSCRSGVNQVALIDAGNDSDGKAILAELSRRQLGPDGVIAIFLTHGHPDHTAGIKLFPKAQVMALDREVSWRARRRHRRGARSPHSTHAGPADGCEGDEGAARW